MIDTKTKIQFTNIKIKTGTKIAIKAEPETLLKQKSKLTMASRLALDKLKLI